MQHARPTLSCLTLTVLLATAAAAATPETPEAKPPPPAAGGSYAWLEIGGGLVDDLEVTTRPPGSVAEANTTWNMSPGFAVYGGFGQKIGSWVELGAMGGFLYNGVDGVEVPGLGSLALDAELMQVPILAFAEVEPPLKFPVRPFVGAGFGTVMSWLNVDQSIPTGSGTLVGVDGSSTEFTFAYELAGGLRWRLRSGASLGLIYRYLNAGNPTWSLNDNSGGTAGTVQADNVRAQTLSLGFYLPF